MTSNTGAASWRARPWPCQVEVPGVGRIRGFALIDQIRVIDPGARHCKFAGRVSDETLDVIRTGLISLLSLAPPRSTPASGHRPKTPRSRRPWPGRECPKDRLGTINRSAAENAGFNDLCVLCGSAVDPLPKKLVRRVDFAFTTVNMSTGLLETSLGLATMQRDVFPEFLK